MRYFYSFGILCYGLGIRLASFFNEKAKLWVKGRKDIFAKMEETLTDNTSPLAWFHSSSLGEFEQCRPVIDSFKEQYPNYKIFVTFFSPSGYEIRKNYPKVDYVFYLPLDTPSNVKRFMQIVKPQKAFFVKYDFWFNYLNELYRNGVPTILFSSIFRPNQYFFKWYGQWFCAQLKNFTHLFVQNKESEILLKGHGITSCTIAGDTRFDQVSRIAANVKKFSEVERFVGASKVLLVGSSWESDERLLKAFIEDPANVDVKMILAPHEIHTSHIEYIQKLFGEKSVKYSEISLIDNLDDYTVLVIDNIGMLSSLYQYAYVAYIGGGFGKGIHNILEAVAFGKPVCFGPNYEKFQEAKDIINLKGGISISDGNTLKLALSQLFHSDENYQKASEVCKQYIDNNKGTSDKIMTVLKKL